jgi:hypothetical protein
MKKRFLIPIAASEEHSKHGGTTAGKPAYHQTQGYCHEPGEVSRGEVDGDVSERSLEQLQTLKEPLHSTSQAYVDTELGESPHHCSFPPRRHGRPGKIAGENYSTLNNISEEAGSIHPSQNQQQPPPKGACTRSVPTGNWTLSLQQLLNSKKPSFPRRLGWPNDRAVIATETRSHHRPYYWSSRQTPATPLRRGRRGRRMVAVAG